MELEYISKERMYKDIKQLLKWLLSTDLHNVPIEKLNKLDAKYYNAETEIGLEEDLLRMIKRHK